MVTLVFRRGLYGYGYVVMSSIPDRAELGVRGASVLRGVTDGLVVIACVSVTCSVMMWRSFQVLTGLNLGCIVLLS